MAFHISKEELNEVLYACIIIVNSIQLNHILYVHAYIEIRTARFQGVKHKLTSLWSLKGNMH